MSNMPPAAGNPASLNGVHHPAGLRTLFFTELWERFSYYGMRALLVLFMVAAIEDGGLGLSDATATAIYGLYTAAVYLVCLPGGWIADRLLGARRAIWYGGIVIMCGHFTLAIPSIHAFFAGLLLVTLGTGLLKPNISAVVGELYPPGDARRDAGFTLYYMGINIGAAIGPLVCSTLGESARFGWHWGFAAAGVGMLVGLIYFHFSQPLLGEAGRHPSLRPENPADRRALRSAWQGVLIGLGLVLGMAGLLLGGVVEIDAVALASQATIGIVLFGALYLAYLLRFGGLEPDERNKVIAIFMLSMAAAMFWAGFEQAGSSLNLFAERFTERRFGGFEIPTGWFQTLNPIFIITLAPVFATIWIRLAARGLEPRTPLKFAFGLLVLGAGFGVMIVAAGLVGSGEKVLPTWLMTTYLLHTIAELTLSPVGLSITTKLAPRRYVGQMMGVWFLTSAIGNLIAGLAAGRFSTDAIDAMPALYTQIVLMTAGTGILLLLLSRPLRRLMGEVK
ncbi:MAG: peptide MFS transporter [Gammaproteobacteria bacterium]